MNFSENLLEAYKKYIMETRNINEDQWESLLTSSLEDLLNGDYSFDDMKKIMLAQDARQMLGNKNESI